MLKRIVRLFALVTFLVGVSFAQLACAKNDTTADAQVKAFYTWYFAIQALEKGPLLDKDIDRWVTKDTVENLKSAWRANRLPNDEDYFTKVQDYDEKDWSAHITTMEPVSVGDVEIVPVTFGSHDRSSVVVFLRQEADAWKIIKVDDVRGFQ